MYLDKRLGLFLYDIVHQMMHHTTRSAANRTVDMAEAFDVVDV